MVCTLETCLAVESSPKSHRGDLTRLSAELNELNFSKISDFGGDARRSGRLQALPVGAVDVLQRRPVPRVDPDEDRQRRTRFVLRTQIRSHAGTHTQSNARGHCGQLAESRRDRTNSQTLQVTADASGGCFRRIIPFDVRGGLKG